MLYRFGPYVLDAQSFELRCGDTVLAAEPQVLSVLLFLVGNRARLVSKDELVDAIWGGRAVSDAVISSRIKSTRRLIGDDGAAQRLIRTVYKRGFRFIGEVVESKPARAAEPATPVDPERPSIAVLPLHVLGGGSPHAIVAEALPQELIRELARLRWIHVIARGSSFRFVGPAPDLRRIGDLLGVRYVLCGTLDAPDDRLRIAVELADTRDGGVVWADRYELPVAEVRGLRDELVERIIAAVDLRIPEHEAVAARSRRIDGMDAWSAYHLGLQRMFRFSAPDNAAASKLFARAIGQDACFARAHAGLSFTCFQDAFLRYADVAVATARARAAAERAVELDPLDPFANAAMGRVHWLSGDLEAGLPWLERAGTISPGYAQGVYARAWTRTLLGEGEQGQAEADRAMALSPLDPLRYAMLATRALSHLIRDDAEQAVLWGERAARDPGAHALITVIAGLCCAAQADQVNARRWIEAARLRQPSLSGTHFLQSFPFSDIAIRERISLQLKCLGL